MRILDEVEKVENYLISCRRILHENPEISDCELNTIQFICEELKKIGIKYVVVPNGGVLGFIEGEKKPKDLKKEKSVLLRADIDALPISESEYNLTAKKQVISKNSGVSHACGHDCHTAMLLAEAKILNSHKNELNGNVFLMFERGEEQTGNVVYILKWIEDNKINIDSAFGIHVCSEIESGMVALHAGSVMTGAIKFQITLNGTGGHGSEPEKAHNPIDCFSAIHLKLLKSVEQRNNEKGHLIFSICSVNSGNTWNVIPDRLTFMGSSRSYDTETGRDFLKLFRSVLEEECVRWGCTYNIDELTGPKFPVINHPECVKLAKEAAGASIGYDRVLYTFRWSGSDSMANILQLFPGVYAFLGIKNITMGSGAPHHTPEFDVDEGALKYGVALAVAYVINFLDSDIQTESAKWKQGVKKLYQYTNSAPEVLNIF